MKKYEFWKELECAGCEVVRRAPAQCCAERDKVHGSFSYSRCLIKFQSIVARQIHRSRESGARLYQEVCGSRGNIGSLLVYSQILLPGGWVGIPGILICVATGGMHLMRFVL